MSADPLALCLAGHLSPEVALARLLLAGQSPDAIAARLQGRDEAGAEGLRSLLTSRRDALEELGAMFADVRHDEPGLDAVRRLFDRAVARAPEASVAAYSLNDPAILTAATDELVAWLDHAGLLQAAFDVLDLGCGIGRVAAAIAPRVRSVLGLDVSAAMIAEAERRCDAANVRFATVGGTGVHVPFQSVDVVLAVDSLPYLLQAGVAEAHVRDCARALRPGGRLAIFNLSYRDSLAQDSADLARWARAYGMQVEADGVAPFKLWDARAFVLRKP